MDGMTPEQEAQAVKLVEELGVSIEVARDIVSTGSGTGCLTPEP